MKKLGLILLLLSSNAFATNLVVKSNIFLAVGVNNFKAIKEIGNHLEKTIGSKSVKGFSFRGAVVNTDFEIIKYSFSKTSKDTPEEYCITYLSFLAKTDSAPQKTTTISEIKVYENCFDPNED